MKQRLLHGWLGLRGAVTIAAFLWMQALHAEPCRLAFDLGSSGVRLAANVFEPGHQSPFRDLDLLTPLMAGQPLEALLPKVEAALRELPALEGLPSECSKMGGGFSAWRLAWLQDRQALIRQLQILRQRTGVAILIIPGSTEGGYGHISAAQTLGPRLSTSHILDIGGGSLQVAGAHRSFSVELGQKSWHRLLCRSTGRYTEERCTLQPLSGAQVAHARTLALEHLRHLPAEVGTVTLTAISRPVTRGIRNALPVQRTDANEVIELKDLSRAIDELASLDISDMRRISRASAAFVDYLLSDMLLVEGVLLSTGNHQLILSEAPINNLPALLRDQRAFEWAERHNCYLERLGSQGPSAYFSDPSDCPTR